MWQSWPVPSSVGGCPLSWQGGDNPELWTRPLDMLIGLLRQACPVPEDSKQQPGRWESEGCRPTCETVSMGLTWAAGASPCGTCCTEKSVYVYLSVLWVAWFNSSHWQAVAAHDGWCFLISSAATWLFHVNELSRNQHFYSIYWGSTKRLC